jgi:DNA-binding protein HU-beta
MEDIVYKKDLADKLADQFDISRKQANEQVNYIFDCLIDSIIEGKTVTITNFGNFSIKEKNNGDKESINYINFKISKKLKNMINE